MLDSPRQALDSAVTKSARSLAKQEWSKADNMMLRKLILAVVLLTSTFVQHAALSSSSSHAVHELRTDRALAHAFALAPEKLGFDSNYKLSLPKPVQDKNFYLLSLF